MADTAKKWNILNIGAERDKERERERGRTCNDIEKNNRSVFGDKVFWVKRKGGDASKKYESGTWIPNDIVNIAGE